MLGCVVIAAASVWLDDVVTPRQAAQVAVESVNDSSAAAERARMFGPFQVAASDAVIASFVVLAAGCFGRPTYRWLARRSSHTF